MNFFEQQARAQRNSGRLLLLMTLAVLSLIAITSLALGIILSYDGSRPFPEGREWLLWLPPWELVGVVSVVIVTVVLVGSLYKWVELRKGGAVIAERLGGRLINLAPRGLEERRLLNVVEEMALASGTPVPPVYVLDDMSINAFAAGFTPQDAVIGITRGAICHLNREELQGVIAHEFSHIFHGDMRLNLRLVAVLNGILLLGLIGGFLARSASRGRRSSKDSFAGAMLLIGTVLWVLGYAGTFFGNLIKAAVSRQREYLADASAVQFTRNPESIAGALKKIGGNQQGSALHSGHAAEFSHMYFASGIRQSLSGLFATHPPLEQRIRRITPGWDGRYPVLAAPEPYDTELTLDVEPPESPKAVPGLRAESALAAIAAVGEPSHDHLVQARDVLTQLDPALHAAAHDCVGARAIAYGLVLDRQPEKASVQLQALAERVSPEEFAQLQQLQPALAALPTALRLPLLDLLIPALRELSRDQYTRFKAVLAVLIHADGRVLLHEWTLLRIIERNVDDQRPLQSYYDLQALAGDASVVLTLLARSGNSSQEQAQAAFDAGRQVLALNGVQMAPAYKTGLAELEKALGRLRALKPLQKPRLLKALARSIEHDGQIAVLEAELFRAVADIIDCPMPPLLSTKT